MHHLPEKLLCILSGKRLQDLSYCGVTSTQCEQARACTETTRNKITLHLDIFTQILITRKSIYCIKLKSMNNSPVSVDDKPRSGRVFDDQ